MPDFEKIYFYLMARIADGIDAIDERNYGQARKILIAAMREAEERYISDGEDEE